MKKIILSTVAIASLLVASNNEYKYEITPMFGYVDTKEHVDIDNHKVGGIAVGINKGDECKFDQIELGLLHTNSADYENSNLETDITRIFTNAIKEYKINDTVKLYALVGLGYEYIDNNLNHNDSDLFFNYGVGAKFKVYEDMALKLDVRHLLKFDGDKNVLYTLGLSIPFGKKGQEIKEKAPVVAPVIEEPVVEKMVKPIVKKVIEQPKQEVVKVAKPIVLVQPEDLGLLFDTDSAKIRSYDLAKFDKYIKYVSTIKNSRIVIEGHTDSTASDKYNLALSKRRANSVKAQFIKMGVDASKLEAIGYGESQPIVDNKTKANRQLNRRVTAKIVK